MKTVLKWCVSANAPQMDYLIPVYSICGPIFGAVVIYLGSCFNGPFRGCMDILPFETFIFSIAWTYTIGFPVALLACLFTRVALVYRKSMGVIEAGIIGFATIVIIYAKISAIASLFPWDANQMGNIVTISFFMGFLPALASYMFVLCLPVLRYRFSRAKNQQ